MTVDKPPEPSHSKTAHENHAIVVHSLDRNRESKCCSFVSIIHLWPVNLYSRRQNMTLKKMINNTAAPCTKNPALPIQNGPGGTFFRPVSRCGAMAITYEVVVKIMNEPARLENAVLLPRVIAPMPVQSTAVKSIAGTGQLSLVLTFEKTCGNGVARSRARAHHIRDRVRNVPIRQMRMLMKTMKSRPNVAPM